MQAVFVCNVIPNIKRVYPDTVNAELTKLFRLDPDKIVTRDRFDENKKLLQSTELIFSTWGMPSLSRDEIKEYLPKLKAVFYAAGTVQYFARPFLELGIRVFSAWAANAVPVAEYTTAQIILANKGYFSATAVTDNASYSRSQKQNDGYPGNYSCKVGLLGCGMIGSMVAERLKAFQLDVLAFDPFMSEEKAQRLGVKKTSLEEIFADCQTVSNHLANNAQTKGMLTYSLFSSMKPNATFINTGRGAQVVEADLIKALKEQPGRLAVLDVTDPEPPEKGSELYSLPNVILTPHIAGSKGLEVYRMAEYMLNEAKRIQDGTPCLYEVTEKMLATMA